MHRWGAIHATASCLNAMLVRDATALGAMAEDLGRMADAAEWLAKPEARAALANATMWDEETGFYYHVTRDGHTFDVAAPGDLKRMEIAGFLPLWAGFAPPDRAAPLIQHLTDPAKFWRTAGVPGLVNGRSEVMRDHCARSNGGLYYETPEEFAAVLELLQRDRGLRGALSEAGRRYVRENYRWETVLEKYRRMIRTVSGSGGGSVA